MMELFATKCSNLYANHGQVKEKSLRNFLSSLNIEHWVRADFSINGETGASNASAREILGFKVRSGREV